MCLKQGWAGDWSTLVRATKEGFLEDNLRLENEKELTVRTFQAEETARAESLKWRKEKMAIFY